MGMLQGLKWIAPKRAASVTPVEFRRAKLRRKIEDQVALAQAQADGQSLVTKRVRRVIDRVSGESMNIESVVRVRCWWYVCENGKLALEVKYGAKPLEFQKGKTAIELETLAQVIPTLEKVREALDAGELDGLIQATSEQLKTRFKPKTD